VIETKDTVSEALRNLIARNSTRLTRADERLLEVLTQDPVRAAIDNGAAVSSRAGVHPASAVRLARRLGFSGYPEFRTFIQSSLIAGGGDLDSPAARMAARLVKADDGGVLSSILDSEIAALEQVRQRVSGGDIRRFAECIRESRRVFVFGRGHFVSLSALVTLRLNRSGYPCVALGSHMHQLPEVLSQMTRKDTLWLFSFRRSVPVLNEIRAIAHSAKATTMAITDLKGVLISPPPDHHIAVSRGAVGESQSLVVPMTIANAIILDLASIDEGHSIRSLERFKAFRTQSGLSRSLT